MLEYFKKLFKRIQSLYKGLETNSIPADSGKLKEPINTKTNEVIYDKKKDASRGTSGSTVPSVSNDASFFEEAISKSRPEVKHQSRDVAAAERANRSLERQNAKLKEDIKGPKKLLRLQKSVTKGKLFDSGSVDIAARTLMKSANAKGDRAELREELNRLYDYTATDKEVTWS